MNEKVYREEDRIDEAALPAPTIHPDSSPTNHKSVGKDEHASKSSDGECHSNDGENYREG